MNTSDKSQKFNLSQLILATEGIWLKPNNTKILADDFFFQGVGTDTRTDLSGLVFVALKGDTHDAHQYLDKAINSKAKALLVHDIDSAKIEMAQTANIVVVLVKDTLKALQNLGHWYRKNVNPTVIGITGSNGKTSSKEFTAQLLQENSELALQLHYNHGSFNNHWGVPLTLLEMPTSTRFALCEMGMNHAGELTELVGIAEPNIVVCTMVGRAHLEGLGSIEGVAKAKEEIYLASNDNCLRIFNLDNEWTLKMFEHSKKKFPMARSLTFSQLRPDADVYLKLNNQSLDHMEVAGHIGQISGSVEVKLFGQHNLTNILCAASIALALNEPPQNIWKHLGALKSAWGRNQLVPLTSGALALFDGYNANPDSQKALMENLKIISSHSQGIGEKWAILGEMRELGTSSSELHFELGKQASEIGLKGVWFFGPHHKNFKEGFRSTKSSIEKIWTTEDFDLNTLNDLKKNLQPKDFIALKGSRGMKLERALAALEPVDPSAAIKT